MGANDQTEVVRDRIVHVATDLFVAHGFTATSTRKICEMAEINSSMVNYYFGTKENLYLAVLEFARHQELKEAADYVDDELDELTAQNKLRLAIANFMKNLLLPGSNSLLTKLIARELLSPSSASAIQNIIHSDILPQHRYLGKLIRAIAKRRLSTPEVQRFIFSILGQALFYSHNRPINELIAPEIHYDDRGIAELAAHVHRFTVAALRSY